MAKEPKMGYISVTSSEYHNNFRGNICYIWVDGPCAWFGDLGVCAKWLVANVPDKVPITFKGFGPNQARVTGKKFRDVGLDVLLDCL